MSAGVLQWSSLPDAMRMNEELLRQCEGAKDPQWLERQLALLLRQDCIAARVWWPAEQRYMPCANKPAHGNLCVKHGGAQKALPAVATLDSVIHEQRRRADSLRSRARLVVSAALLLAAAERQLDRAEAAERLACRRLARDTPVEPSDRRDLDAETASIRDALVAEGFDVYEAHYALRHWLSPYDSEVEAWWKMIEKRDASDSDSD